MTSSAPAPRHPDTRSPATATEEPQCSLSDEELAEAYDFALDLARRAGQILLDGVAQRCGQDTAGRRQGEKEKDSSVDIVTQTDLDVEAFVQKEITERYPDHDFIGEETYASDPRLASLPANQKPYLITNKPTWVVDPLDGTVNYTHLFDMFCVSIALVLNHSPVVGVIHAPMLDVTYSAYRGYGAFMNDSTPSSPAGPAKRKLQLPLVRNPIPPLPVDAPKGCIFSCEWGKDRRDVEGSNMHRKVETFLNMAAEPSGRRSTPGGPLGGLGTGPGGGMVHGVRMLGSATMDIAYIARGSTDIWWEGGCWEWDVAAGICILSESGGLITTGRPPADPAKAGYESAEIPEVRLGGRHYLGVRAAGDRVEEVDGKMVVLETGREGQERVVREVWKRVYMGGLAYERPGH